jgi:predicted GNAT family acetyltransferase
VQPGIPHPVLNELTDPQIKQLHALYQGEWWSTGRTLAEVHTMLEHSDFIFAIAAPDTQQLLAFARVLSDHIFKAMVFDVIVHPDHRSAGLGSLTA